jgi:thiol-disulfide isomerase/thioredoxin
MSAPMSSPDPTRAEKQSEKQSESSCKEYLESFQKEQVEQIDPKSLITRTTYRNIENPGNILTTYTASWCGPCTRIKAHFPEILKNYTFVKEDCMIKTDFKENINSKIPFFVKEGRVNDSLQSSDPVLVKQFVE